MWRYLGGVKLDPLTLRLALVEAGEGKVGTAFDQILLYCFHYDEAAGRYGPAAFHLMQIAGGLTVPSSAACCWCPGGGKSAKKTAPSARRSILMSPCILCQARSTCSAGCRDARASGSFWLPPPASSHAPDRGRPVPLLLAISTFFFLLIVVLMTRIRDRLSPPAARRPAASPSHNTLLEISLDGHSRGHRGRSSSIAGSPAIWSCATPPKGRPEIRVTGEQWKWLFEYPNGYVDGELHVPVDEPVLLIMTSSDVVHSLFIPVLRVKMDVVPGRYSRTWFCANEAGRRTSCSAPSIAAASIPTC